MAERNLKDADQNKAIHAMRQEHRINRVVLPIAALYVVFLMWTALTNFSLALKIATVAFFITLVYFAISDTMYLYDKIKKKREK
ncbi:MULTISPECIES: hypothetical protein [Lactobacillus]|uniref:Uncharacterized protein n=1 Tax=Lactobacillus melliventris TaxID=1218507 RepID=A0ABX5N3T5_9LACO|nr:MULTISPECIES: hypothetical protein [Lactobacillus]MCT6888981.1 hypothetical protein [Lactobacillus sp.]MBC6350488.1 hypothetical protein [Lactobacillus melliventris]MBH9990362.1 hypothetical protein [Lactobacillus sp. M0392]MBI0023162.1 hypothetical protein [Lactobacillus sp. W8171]MBI0045345.1 hypothetical protein [Lactobacillus sp. M0393]